MFRQLIAKEAHRMACETSKHAVFGNRGKRSTRTTAVRVMNVYNVRRFDRIIRLRLAHRSSYFSASTRKSGLPDISVYARP
jgi:hypothetical protein